MKLVIVESPTKAKTISRFLGKGYKVLSSFGHVRDLPKSKMGVDVEHAFEPTYTIPVKAKKIITELKSAASKAEEVILASDEDREGEAIAWHLVAALGLDTKKKTDQKISRIVFHEITKKALEEALAHPRTINQELVDAQQARRILDRLVGYELSPFLWKKVSYGLSAGRVQSAAVRLIVEREREREAFKAQEYWTIQALLAKGADTFEAQLAKKDGTTLDKFALGTQKDAEAIVQNLQSASYIIADVTKKTANKKPPTPLTTSLLQQEAGNKLGFSAKQTMRLAQQLYEGVEIPGEGHAGLITYMRTDSLNLSNDAVALMRDFIEKDYGKDYLPEKPRFYKSKSKGAQEAHEAIRPTDATRTPDNLKSALDARQWKLYHLIWSRALASQMADAVYDQTSVAIDAKSADTVYGLKANGSLRTFDGFQKVYVSKTEEKTLPRLTQGDVLTAEKLEPEQHFTEPPARYSEATLVKALEEHGIGRPSTYAPTISTVQDRNYVAKDDAKRLYPTDIGKLVNDILVEHFKDIVDIDFTAEMEEKFDCIARGECAWRPTLQEFYTPFKANLVQKEATLTKKELTEQKTDEVCDKCGKPMVIKTGRFGQFLACTGYPECKNTKPLGGAEQKSEEMLEDKKCPECGKPMAVKHGRYGKFLGCSGYPDCTYIEKIEKKTGVTCPKCSTGDMVERRTRAGKTFYGCNNYPKCDFALWSKPTGEKCPECSSPLVFAAKDTVKCSNKECGFEKKS